MSAIAVVTDERFVRPVERFFQRPDIHSSIELLRRRLSASATILIAGGAIRNLFIAALYGEAPATLDIDIFIGGLPRDFAIGRVLADQHAEETDLKGIRWYPRALGLAFDLCRLDDFLVIRSGNLKPTIENLLTGIDFTMNAVIYDPYHSKLVEKACLEAVRNRMIDFNSHRIPDKHLIAYRILLMAHKTGFIFSETVFQYARTRLDLDTLTHLKHLFAAKQGKDEAGVIMGAYQALCRFPSYEAYRSAMRSMGT